MSSYAAPLAGLAAGLVIGFMVRRARLCSFGAIEDALGGGDFRRLRVFVLALAVAIAGTQMMIAVSGFSAQETSYVPQRLAWLSIFSGAVMFGIGMALVGTCGFGCLVRLGGGDLRAFVVILTFAAAAYALLRGALAPLRVGVLESISVPMPGGHPAGLIELIEGLTGFKARLLLSAVMVLSLGLFVFRDRRLLKAPRLMSAGIALGLAVCVGWLFTGVIADDFASHRVQSLTFVAPVARGVFSIVLGGVEWLEFSTMSVPGVIIGSLIAARRADEFHWEAFDDHHEMRRHLAGAILMGAGGVLAGGCTIGQGVAAGSLLALSWPLAMAGILIGARIGMAILVEGSVRYWLADLWGRHRDKSD